MIVSGDYENIKKDVFARARTRILVLYLAGAIVITATVILVINAQSWQIDLLMGFFVLILLGAYTYALARASLRPIQKTTERQRRFAVNVAHELRTPLSVMRMNFEVALMEMVEGGGGDLPG